MRRLTDRELEEYENNIAKLVNIRKRIKRLQYWTDDPDILEEFANITINTIEVQRFIRAKLAEDRGE